VGSAWKRFSISWLTACRRLSSFCMYRFIACCKGVKEGIGYCWQSQAVCRVLSITEFPHACCSGIGEMKVLAVETGGDGNGIDSDD